MKQYTVNTRFFCTPLKKYLPVNAVLYRSDISTRLVIASANDSENPSNYTLGSFEVVDPKSVAWFDSLVAAGYSSFLTLNGTLSETVNGVGYQGYSGSQGYIGTQGFRGFQGVQGV